MSLRRSVLPCLVALFLPTLQACGESVPETSGGAGGSGGSTTSSSTSNTSSSTSTTSANGGQGGSGGQGDGWGGSDWNDPDLAAVAGADLTVLRGQNAVLQGSYTWAGSMSGIASSWLQVSGEPVALGDPDSFVTSFTAPDVLGPLVFRLRVKDDFGHGKSDEVTVTVADPAPVADAGEDQGAPGGVTVTLNGSGSGWADPALTYAWKQVSGPPTPVNKPTSATPKLVIPADLEGPIVYALTVNDGYLDSEPDWVTLRRVEGTDADGDLLDDATEAQLGTDPTSADTDLDGVPDGWEELGHEDVDYPGLGCSALHMDLLVELDYQEYTDSNGLLHSAHPSPATAQALVDTYASMPVENPDGLPGIALRFLDDSVLPQSFVCVYSIGIPQWGDTSPSSFLHREAFHRVQICLADPATGGGGGIADIGGRAFTMSFPEMNADPADDLDEEAALRLYAIFLHEMGHNLGLRHGGDENLNYKPVYPSLMNYEFTYTMSGSPLSIAGTKVTFSRGLLPPVDECSVIEKGIFGGVPPEDIAFLPSYGQEAWTVAADGSVDWDHDGTLAPAPYERILRESMALGDPATCQKLHDHDDYAAIHLKMGSSVPSDPGSGAPPALRFKGKDRPERMP